MFSLKLPIEPASEIAQGFSDGVFAVDGRLLARRAVAHDLNGHAVFVIVLASVGRLSRELVEVPPLHGLETVSDAVQRWILRGIVTDVLCQTLGVAEVALVRCAIALAAEPRKPDTGFLLRAAAYQADGGGFEADAKDFADTLEILVDRIPPVIMGDESAIPTASLVFGRIGKFRELVNRGADDLRHRGPPRAA